MRKPKSSSPIPTISNSFESVLRNQRKGALLTEISEAMQTAVLSVRELMKEATVTIKLKISPANGDASALSLDDEVTTKLPTPKKPNTLFYSTDEGVLCREDPNQAEIEFQPVASASNADRSPATQAKSAAASA